MNCIDINFSVIISSDIYDWVNTSAGGVLVPQGIIRCDEAPSRLLNFVYKSELKKRRYQI
jgi:hypothetical protein